MSVYVDNFAVSDEIYKLTPRTDSEPIKNSPFALTSNGAWVHLVKDRGAVPAENNGVFTRQGAYDYFLGETADNWLKIMFGSDYADKVAIGQIV